MAKFYYCFILLFYSINIINADTNNTNNDYKSNCNGHASLSSECFDKILDVEKDDNFHCCFLKAKENNNQNTFCSLLDEEAFLNINDYIESQQHFEYEVLEVDCKSFYLSLSLLYLILILL